LPLAEFELLKLPFYFVENHCAEATVALVKLLEVDLLVNAGTPRILKRAILQAAPRGVLSCHPGLLPGFRGCTCVEWAVYLDEQVGNTVFFMNEAIDEGPIVLQEALTFGKHQAYADVRTEVYARGHELLARAVAMVGDQDLHADELAPQSDGRYFGVIDDVRLQEVKTKLAEGRYAFQR
jgi:methionyl-tRNA formyltransferase